jgi:hypothetical protein
MLESSKHAFWQALLLTLVVFILGMFLGIAYEGNKLDEINDYYALSEISLMDAFALSSLSDDSTSCEILRDAHIEFANKIYEEAFLLEQYEDSGKITDGLRLAHKKYDLLRTLLWIDSTKTIERCESDLSVIVYLYEYETDDLTQRANQRVWSRILFDLKQEKGDEILLIPIAADSDLTSLNSLLKKYGISEFPMVFIDNRHIVTDLSSLDDLNEYLN